MNDDQKAPNQGADDRLRVPPPSVSMPDARGVQIGSGNQQHNYYSGVRQPAAWPHLVGVLPPQADCYQNRNDITDLLSTTVTTGATVVLGQVLSGLGGVGKTQAAAAYARRRWEDSTLDLLVWISASSREAIVSGYAQAGDEIEPGIGEDAQRAVQRFLAWLRCTHRRWLIVLDDVSDPGDLRGLWPPTSRCGQMLITTRRRDAALRNHERVMVDVGLFTPAVASAYLTQKLTPHTSGGGGALVGAAELAAELDYLPLALAQAAAYILDRGLGCPTYRRRLADRRRQLPDLLPEPAALPDDHHASLAVTWSLSVEQANQLQPRGVAGPVLNVASMLDPNGIPTDLFTAPDTLAYLTYQCGRDVDAQDSTDALHALHRLNLITLTAPTSTQPMVRVHGLIQRATREQLPNDGRELAARAAADALSRIWPHIENQPAISALLRANTDALHTNAERTLWTENGHPLMFQAGRSLGEAGLVTAATAYFQRLNTTAQCHLGSDHPDTLAARGNLAFWQGEAGDPAGAVAAFQQVLTDRLRVLGPDHPDTLATRHNLARWRGSAGDSAGAVTAFQQLLVDHLRVLGPAHPETLATRHNLARWRGEAGDAPGAVTAFQQLLADRLQVLGADHPDTLATRNNLARWRGGAGDAPGAVTAFQQVLADRLRVLGADHPHTLNTRAGLAYWRGEAGDAPGAVIAFQQLLADCLRVLGPDHPHTLTTRNNLAHWQKRGCPGSCWV